MCGNIETNLKNEFKRLGQILFSSGLAGSVVATVNDRENLWCVSRNSSGCEWLAITKCQRNGNSFIVVGVLLHGAGTGMDVSVTTVKSLNQIQWWFLSLVLQVGQGAPLVSLTWDNCVQDMSIRIQMEMILMILSIRELSEDPLTRRVYEEQKSNKCFARIL